MKELFQDVKEIYHLQGGIAGFCYFFLKPFGMLLVSILFLLVEMETEYYRFNWRIELRGV